MMQVKLKYIAQLLVFYTAFFPYLSFGLNSLDSQPWFLLAALFYCFFGCRFSRFWLVVSLSSLAILLLFSFPGLEVGGVYESAEFLIIRGVIAYLTFFLGFGVFSAMHREGFIPGKAHFYIVSSVYAGVGLCQYFGISVFDFLSPNRTTEGRGVTSLAAEPTFFGLIILFLNLYKHVCCRQMFGRLEIKFYSVFEACLVFFLCKSTMVFFLVVVLVVCAMLVNKRVAGWALAAILPVLFWLFLYSGLLEGSRVYKLTRLVLENPRSLIIIDESINSRTQDIVFPYIGMMNNGLLPGGLISYGSFSERARSASGGIFYYGGGDKVMSFMGSIIYELGLIGLVISYWALIRFLRTSALPWPYFPFYCLLYHMAIPITAGYALVLLSLVKRRLPE